MNDLKSIISHSLISIIIFLLCFHPENVNSQNISSNFIPLDAEEAFKIEYTVTGPSEAVVRWKMPKLYYLYKDKFKFSSNDFTIKKIYLPNAEIKIDPYFGYTEVYYEVIEATLNLSPIQEKKESGILEVSYQGCWEGGICYPKIKTSLILFGL